MSTSLLSIVEQLKKQIAEAYEATKFAASYLEEKAMKQAEEHDTAFNGDVEIAERNVRNESSMRKEEVRLCSD
ncbi:hypothetical protein QR680_018016 [Steinernema hermaphroditum]|uniref:Uncharacterized protein n=1 Tax=Steinernema hermaphroditum TaxID=289476 RepID=A0AA39LQ28_9BILA|nr:hypothetical protein QR680_018016 [Steinernema hermaphroditum]